MTTSQIDNLNRDIASLREREARERQRQADLLGKINRALQLRRPTSRLPFLQLSVEPAPTKRRLASLRVPAPKLLAPMWQRCDRLTLAAGSPRAPGQSSLARSPSPPP